MTSTDESWENVGDGLPSARRSFSEQSHTDADPHRDSLNLGGLANLLDVKGLLKLLSFTGRDEDFAVFYESFINVLAAMDMDEITEYVGRMSEPRSFAIMSP